jgi:uncharacterized protein (TIGR03435 family)
MLPRSIAGTGLIGLLAIAAFGQPADTARSFEVASVKVHEGPMRRLGVTTTGQTLTADSANIRMLVMYAYNVKNFQVSGPAPLLAADNTRWDIVAKAPGDHPPSRAEFRQMMQLLLADRFQLKVHQETREMPVYALTVGKNGPKFKESEAPDGAMSLHSMKGRNNVLTLPKATMSEVVDAVSNAFLDRPVVDQTGLTGAYDIKLTYTPNTRANTETDPDLSDISVFQALQEQLGLKLEAKAAKVEVLIVDKAASPSVN